MLTVFYPARRTGGNQRKYAVILYTVDKLMCLFHNGEVCTEIRVKYLIKSNPAQGGCHLALDIRSDRIAKLFA